MTQKEFDERMGKESTQEEYVKADGVYMASQMEKDEFCQQYKKHECDLLHDITDRYYAADRHYKECLSQRNTFAKILLEIAEEENASKVRAEVRNTLGIKEYVKFCLEKGFSLEKEDREFIVRFCGL